MSDKIYDKWSQEMAQANSVLEAKLKKYKKTYKKVILPELIRSWILHYETECASKFPYSEENYAHLYGTEKTRKIREDKWRFMLTMNRDDPYLIDLLDRLDPSKMDTFCKDIATIYSLISDRIHTCKFEDMEEPPDEYDILYTEQFNPAIDLLIPLDFG